MALLPGVVDSLYNPRVIPRAVKRGRALPTPVLWLDAAAGNFSNQGQAGNLLDAQNGSTGGVDTNDVQVLPHNGTNYLYLPGVAGNNVTVPDLAAYTPSTSLDVRVAVAMDAVSGTQAFIGHYNASGTDRSWLFMYTSTNVTLYLSTNGTTASNFSPSVSPTITAGTVTLLRATWTASPAEVKFFQKSTTEGAAADDLAVDTGWTQVGSTITASVPAVALANSAAPLAVGSQSGIDLLAGRVYRVQVRSGGTTVFDANFTRLTSGGATSFTESSANAATVTINRATGNARKSVVVTEPTWLLGVDDRIQVANHPLLNFAAGAEFSLATVTRFFDSIDSSASMMRKGTVPVYDLRFAGGLPQRGTACTVSDGTNSASGFAGGSNRSPGVRSLAHAARQGTLVRVGHNGRDAADTSIATVTGAQTNTESLTLGWTAAANYEMWSGALFRRALSDGEMRAWAVYHGNTDGAY